MNARKDMQQHASYKRFMQSAGRIGSVRSLEVTHGPAGWHVHTHDLGFLEHPLKLQGRERGMKLADFEERYRGFWRPAARRSGLRTGPGALHLKQVTHEDFRDEWDIVAELTHGYRKAASAPNRSPMQLLHAYMTGDEEAGALFRTFALATKGRKRLVWSDGLEHRLGQTPEMAF